MKYLLAAEINITAYYQMPKLYGLDDFDKCLTEYPLIKATYCYTDVTIKPDENSSLWIFISEYTSNNKRNLRHDRLQRGLCINWCIDKLSNLSDSELDDLYTPIFDRNISEITFDPTTYKNAISDRDKYNKIVNQCVNLILKKDHKLMAYTEVANCVTNRDVKEIDWLDISFLCALLVLCALITCSTIYDFRLKLRAKKKSEHYKKSLPDKMSSILASFSITRSWYALTAESNGRTARDLRGIQGVRFLSMFGIIMGHVALLFSVMPYWNTDYIEKNFDRVATMMLINGQSIIQTYLTVSGFLLSIQFFEFIEKQTKFNIHYLWKGVLYRYVRLVPVYAFLIFYNATWLLKMQDGPIWNHEVEPERTYCRRNWWTNLLFVNNYVHRTEPCIQQGWYLAVDFQLSIVFLAILMVIWKFPKSLKFVLSAAAVVCLIIPIVVIYIFKFDGIVITVPESQKYKMWYVEQYHEMHTATHTNGGCYLVGIIFGYLYLQLRKSSISLKKSKIFAFFWWMIVPIGSTTLLTGYIFYAYDYEKPAIWIGIYSTIVRNVWGVIVGILLIGLAHRVGWVGREILNQPIFRVFGRLTFSVYLIHPIIIRSVYGDMRQPAHLSDNVITSGSAASFFLSYIGGLLLYICIEAPFSSLQKHIMRSDRAVNENVVEITKC